MIQIRRGIFETNSSSVHSLTFISDADWEKFTSGEYVFDTWEDKIVLPSEVEPSACCHMLWYDKPNNYYEFDYEFTSTKLPDGGHANYICYYGYDG